MFLKTGIRDNNHLPDILRKGRTTRLANDNFFVREVNQYKNTSNSLLSQLPRMTDRLPLAAFEYKKVAVLIKIAK